MQTSVQSIETSLQSIDSESHTTVELISLEDIKKKKKQNEKNTSTRTH